MGILRGLSTECVPFDWERRLQVSNGATDIEAPMPDTSTTTASPFKCMGSSVQATAPDDLVQSIKHDGLVDDVTRQCIMQNLEIAELRRANQRLQQRAQRGAVVRERVKQRSVATAVSRASSSIATTGRRRNARPCHPAHEVAVQTDTLFAASPASRSPSAPKHQYASMAALQWQLQCMQEQLASMEGRGTRQRSSLHRDDARLMEYMQRLVDDKLEQDAERIAMLESRNVLLEYDILALSEEVELLHKHWGHKEGLPARYTPRSQARSIGPTTSKPGRQTKANHPVPILDMHKVGPPSQTSSNSTANKRGAPVHHPTVGSITHAVIGALREASLHAHAGGNLLRKL